jgi:enoyl-CoA hydratase
MMKGESPLDSRIPEEEDGEITLETYPEKYRANLIIENPQKHNAISLRMEKELNNKIVELDQNDDIKVVVIRGKGDNFSTGHDLDDVGRHHGWEKDSEERPSQRRRLAYDDDVMWGKRGLMGTLLNSKLVTIAEIQGYCYGLAFEFSVGCDITITSKDAVFTHPAYRWMGPTGSIPLLFMTIGVKRTKEMMFTGRKLEAMEAQEWGLVNRVVDEESLQEEVDSVAEVITQLPKDGIAMGKANLELAHDMMGINSATVPATHVWQTNIKYEDDEYNLFKERSEKGRQGAIESSEERFEDSQLSRDSEE